MGCYLNDIIITGKNTEEHLNHLSCVFEQLQDKGFRLKKDKCQFLQSSVEHLGHVIDTNGLHTTLTNSKLLQKPENEGHGTELHVVAGYGH